MPPRKDAVKTVPTAVPDLDELSAPVQVNGLRDESILAAEISVPQGTYLIVLSDGENVDSHDVYFVPTGISSVGDGRINVKLTSAQLDQALIYVSGLCRENMEGIAKVKSSTKTRKSSANPVDIEPDKQPKAPKKVAAPPTGTDAPKRGRGRPKKVITAPDNYVTA